MNSRNRDGNPEFENHLFSIKTERQKKIHLAHILPIMNVSKKL